jgi:XTP/dITP diphosphohydrolase
MTPPRQLNPQDTLVIASHNMGKVREITELLYPLGITVASAGTLGLEEPEETGTSYIENAELKAKLASQSAGLPALADDSGLSVRALGGAPGIYSARWAGADKDFNAAMKRVADAVLMAGTQDRHCEFVCALSLAWPDGHWESFEGRVAGTVTWPQRGDRGFGYDAIFTPLGYELTFAEMDPETKHAMSHRADAFRQLLASCLIPA